MERFQGDLNHEILDRVELLPYNDLNNLVQLCVRIEPQIGRRSTTRKDYPNTFYSRRELKREGYSSKSKKYKRGREKKKEIEKYNYRVFF